MPDVPKLGNSKPIDAEPLAGFRVTAAADAFERDTEIKIAKAESFTDPEWTAAQQLFEEGFCVIDAYHLDAGLADEQVIPGEYAVTIDLATLELDPGLLHASAGNYHPRFSPDGEPFHRAERRKGGAHSAPLRGD